MNNGDKPIANPFVVLREEFDDWAVLFNPDNGYGFGLNPTGVYLWKLLDGTCSIDEMLTVLRRDADDVPAEAGQHLFAFVDDLIFWGLVTFAAAPSTHSLDRGVSRSGRQPASGPIATKFVYEVPQLINLSGERAVQGGCCGGASGAACTNGNYTSTGNCSEGISTGGACYCTTGDTVPQGCNANGISAQYMGCKSYGMTPTGSYCRCNGAAPTYWCNAGT